MYRSWNISEINKPNVFNDLLPFSGEHCFKFCFQHCMLLESSLLSFGTFLSYGGNTTIQIFFPDAFNLHFRFILSTANLILQNANLTTPNYDTYVSKFAATILTRFNDILVVK